MKPLGTSAKTLRETVYGSQEEKAQYQKTSRQANTCCGRPAVAPRTSDELLRRYDHPSQANSGKDALEQIEHKTPDIILLDLNLPDMNGLEVARQIRRSEKTGRIPILAMSGNPMDLKKCLEMGCTDFVQKPFDESTLLVRLSALIPHRSRSLN